MKVLIYKKRNRMRDLLKARPKITGMIIIFLDIYGRIWLAV